MKVYFINNEIIKFVLPSDHLCNEYPQDLFNIEDKLDRGIIFNSRAIKNVKKCRKAFSK